MAFQACDSVKLYMSQHPPFLVNNNDGNLCMYVNMVKDGCLLLYPRATNPGKPTH